MKSNVNRGIDTSKIEDIFYKTYIKTRCLPQNKRIKKDRINRSFKI